MRFESEKKVEHAWRFFVEQSMNSQDSDRRGELLREFFVNASLIAAMKELAEEVVQIEQLAQCMGLEPEHVADAPAPAA